MKRISMLPFSDFMTRTVDWSPNYLIEHQMREVRSCMSDVAFWFVLILFIVTLTIVILGKINETAATLLGMALCGLAVVLDGRLHPVTGDLLTLPSFISLIEWDTVLFIASMMMVVAIATSSGMFQYTALVLTRRTGGDPKKVFRAFMYSVFAVSLFLDPLPTILVMAPFTIQVCHALEMDFRPLLVTEVMVANIASFPIVVASIPNLVIVSWAGIPPANLLLLAPLSLLLMFVTVAVAMWTYGRAALGGRPRDRQALLSIEPASMIRSKRDFWVSASGLAALMVGLVVWPDYVAFTSIAVSSIMLAFSHDKATEMLKELSWDTVFFLIGIFGMINALEIVGVIAMSTAAIANIVGSNAFIGILMMIWIPGAALAAVDNISVAAFLAPMAVDLDEVSHVVPLSLVIGANVGGYLIPFGDAPNIYVISESEASGNPLSLVDFAKATVPLGLLHLSVATLYCFVLALLI